MAKLDVPFYRMNGAGNRILVVDMRARADKLARDAVLVLAADKAAGFDQIMELSDAAKADNDLALGVINADGSPAAICGNGTRCVVSVIAGENGHDRFRFEAVDGVLSAEIGANGITVDMGVPKFDWQAIPLTEPFHDTSGIELQVGPIDAPILHTPSVVNMHNTHAVFWAEHDVEEYDLGRFGPMLENHPIFANRANISIVNVCNAEHIRMRTWERGAGLTLACGSGACAAQVSARRKGYTGSKATVSQPGGDLEIEWREDGRVFMTGPVELEFTGYLDPQSGAYVRD